MELTHLNYFLAVAEELHFGRAARRLHIAQPPLSRRIMLLEEELGAKLFSRSSRKVELTEAGTLFVKEARAILERAADAAGKIRALGVGTAGAVVIGFNEPAINTFLSAAIRSYRETWPDVRLSLLELETAEQLDALRGGRIDVGVIRPFGHDFSGLGLGNALLLRERYVVAMPRGHRLANTSKRLPLAALRNESFIIFPRAIQPLLRDRLTACCESAGFTPRVSQEANGKQTTLALVEAGMGVALVPESSSRNALPGVVFRPTGNELPPVDLHAAWRLGQLTPAADNLLKALRTCAGKMCKATVAAKA